MNLNLQIKKIYIYYFIIIVTIFVSWKTVLRKEKHSIADIQEFHSNIQ